MNRKITYTFYPVANTDDCEELDRDMAVIEWGEQTIALMETLLRLRPDDTVKLANKEGELMVEYEPITESEAREVEANAE